MKPTLWQRDSKSGKWGVRYIDPGTSRERKRIIGNRAQAERFLQGLLAGNPIGDQLLLRQAFDTYHKTCAKHIRKAWFELLPNAPLPVDRESFQEWVRRLRAVQGHPRLSQLKPASLRRYWNPLQAVFSRATQDGLCWGNPALPVQPARSGAHRMTWLTEEEAARILEHLPEHLALAVTFAIHTGVRPSELVSIRPTDICWETGALSVWEHHSGKNKRCRQIPLTEKAKEAAQLWQQRRPESGRVFSFSYKHIAKHFRLAAEAAGVAKVCLYVTRHTFASWFVMRGGDIYRLKELMGHSSVTVTEKYAHLDPAKRDSALQFMG